MATALLILGDGLWMDSTESVFHSFCKCVKIYCPNINFTGTCCSDCNRSCVIPARMKDFFKVREEEEEEEGEEEEEEEEEGEEESRIIHPTKERRT